MRIRREELHLFARALNEMTSRLAAAGDFLERPTWPGVEAAALQVRTTIELIPLASLVTHSDLAEKEAPAFRARDRREAKKLIDRINPEYWPHPVRVTDDPEDPARDRVEPVSDGFLRQEDAHAAWSALSERLLHARSPYRQGASLASEHGYVRSVWDQLVVLLAAHWLRFPEREEYALGFLGRPGKVCRRSALGMQTMRISSRGRSYKT